VIDSSISLLGTKACRRILVQNTYITAYGREGDPKGWSKVLVIALGSREKLVPPSHIRNHYMYGLTNPTSALRPRPKFLANGLYIIIIIIIIY
jgi:hypothetical protein